MERERWRQLQQLFERALDLAANDREAFLHDCPDEGLRREVAAMLAAVERGEPITSAVARELRSLAEARESSEVAAGRRVGPYRVLREIGRGGMGVVFLAERADGEFEQRAALKLMHGSLLHPGRLQRFQAERQILANLRHPGIAQLLDGGTTDDGVPYLVMEHVAGEPIDRYCDGRNQTVDDRLRLFRRVCAATEAAHRSLVVHRDLKPSNILVGEDGEPKLLDFGVAKLLEPEPGLEPGLTIAGERVMTPEYASPEQVRAETVSTATDVYALGLLLYELLTGRRAQRLASTRPEDVERAVCRTPPRRPSVAVTEREPPSGDVSAPPADAETIARCRGTSATRLARRLSGDLDTIILTALRKEPERRYGSVSQLSEDVRRHQDGWPILARADSWRYRAGKFVRRHRTAVVAAAVVAASLLVAAATSTWGLLRARKAESEAVQQAAKAEEIAGFLERLFAVSDPSEARGNSITAREILERGVERIDSELADQPVVQGRLLTTMGRVHAGLGLTREANTLFEKAYAVQREALGEQHADTLLALGSLGNTFVALGQFEAAEGRLRQAYETARVILGEDHVDTLKYLGNLAVAVWRQGRSEEAVELCRRTLELRRRFLGEEHLHTQVAASVLASALLDAGRLSEAAAIQEEVLESMTRRFGRDHPQTLHAINNLAAAYAKLGRYQDEEALGDEAVELSRRILGEDNPRTLTSRTNRALRLAKTGDYRVAEEEGRAVLARQTEVLGPDHPTTLWTQRGLGVIYRDGGHLAEAEAQLRASLNGRRETLGAQHWETLQSVRDLGRLYEVQGRLGAAEELYREALSAWREQSAGQPSTFAAMCDLGGVLSAQGRGEEAEALLLPAVAGLRDSFPGRALLLSECLTRLGRHRQRHGSPDAARRMLLEALALVQPLHTATHRAPEEALQELGLEAGEVGAEAASR